MALLDGLAAPPDHLKRILEEVPAAIAVHDADGVILARNQRFDDVLPDGAADLRKLTALDANGQPLAPESSPIARALAGEVVIAHDAVLGRADGSTRPVRVSALPLRAGGVVLLTDPPGNDLLLKQILGIVGHDLRNPLAAIRMTAQLLAKDAPVADDRRQTLAKRIVSSSGRMDALVRGLLEFARAQAGAIVQLSPEPSNLEALVRHVVDDQRLAFPNRVISAEMLGNPDVHWDPDRIEQVLSQLVGNALRHGTDEAPVSVRVDATAAEEVLIVVNNRGPAIAPESLTQVFDPFMVGPRAPGAPRKNIGLGLFVVRKFVEAHGGSVTAASNAPEGTTLSVRLPRTFRQPDVTAQ